MLQTLYFRLHARVHLFMLAALLLALTACNGAADTPTVGSPTPAAAPTTNSTAPGTTAPGGPAGSRISVVATTTQIRSMAEAVAGTRATVRAILKPGADPHSYEPVPSDVQALATSALVLRNGVGLDTWLDKIIAGAGGARPVVTVSDGVPVRQGAEQEPAGDPHIWFSVANAMTMTRTIRDALVRVDPAGAATYQANGDTYLQRLADLDTYIKAQIATLPAGSRKMVTNHDAFGYYIDRYGLTFAGSIIPSISTDSAPSAADVATLIKKIRAEQVRAIFLESSVNPQLGKQIGDEAGVRVVDTLYGDSLGDAGTPGATYEGMMRYDTDTIVNALK